MADEVVVIHRGRLVTHTSVAALTVGAGTVRVRTPHAERLADLVTAAGATVDRREPEVLAVLGMLPSQVGELAAEARVVLHELVGETHSLEDVFFELTAGEAQRAVA